MGKNRETISALVTAISEEMVRRDYKPSVSHSIISYGTNSANSTRIGQQQITIENLWHNK